MAIVDSLLKAMDGSTGEVIQTLSPKVVVSPARKALYGDKVSSVINNSPKAVEYTLISS